jgi:hypothetical protein
VSARSKTVRRTIANLLAQAINSDDADRAARIIQEALGIERDDVANYCFPKEWPTDRERRARSGTVLPWGKNRHVLASAAQDTFSPPP